jgi:hypothetical protein
MRVGRDLAMLPGVQSIEKSNLARGGNISTAGTGVEMFPRLERLRGGYGGGGG